MKWYLIASNNTDTDISTLTFHNCKNNRKKLIQEYKTGMNGFRKYDNLSLVLVHSLDKYFLEGQYIKADILKTEGKESNA